jgi:hypothetical protein
MVETAIETSPPERVIPFWSAARHYASFIQRHTSESEVILPFRSTHISRLLHRRLGLRTPWSCRIGT